MSDTLVAVKREDQKKVLESSGEFKSIDRNEYKKEVGKFFNKIDKKIDTNVNVAKGINSTKGTLGGGTIGAVAGAVIGGLLTKGRSLKAKDIGTVAGAGIGSVLGGVGGYKVVQPANKKVEQKGKLMKIKSGLIAEDKIRRADKFNYFYSKKAEVVFNKLSKKKCNKKKLIKK